MFRLGYARPADRPSRTKRQVGGYVHPQHGQGKPPCAWTGAQRMEELRTGYRRPSTVSCAEAGMASRRSAMARANLSMWSVPSAPGAFLIRSADLKQRQPFGRVFAGLTAEITLLALADWRI